MEQVGIKLTATDGTKPAFDSVSASLTKLQGSAAGFSASLASLGAGISVAGFLAITKAAIDSVDALNDVKDATGASIENISALEDIAKRTGTSFDTVGSSLIKLNQALNAATPDSAAAKAITAIGLSVKDLKQLDPAEAFQKVAVALNGFADDGNKARLSQELFGKSLREIAPLLNDVAAAGKLVGSVTTQQAEEAEKFNKELFALKANVQDASRALAIDLVTSINAATKAWREYGAYAAFTSIYNGDDQFKNNKTLVDQTEKLLTLENEVLALKKGSTALDAALLRRKQEDLKVLQEQIKTTLAYRKVLEGDTPNNTAPKPSAPDIGNGPDKAALAAANAELKKQADLLNTLSGVNADYQESLTRLQAIKASGRISDEKYVELVNQLIEKQPMVVEQRKQEAELDRARLKSLDEYVKAQEKALEAQQQSAATAAKELQKFDDEEKALVIAAEKNISLAQAIAEVELARLRETQAKALAANADGATLLALQQEIAAREKIAAAIGRKDVRDATAKTAKEAADEWKRASDQIEQSITDALLRGFESGKGFGENLRDTLENMFKTLVLRPVIQATVQGALGIPGTPGGAGSFAGGGGNLLSDFGGSFAGGTDKLGQYLINNSGTNKALGDFGASLVQNSKTIGSYAQKAGNILSYLDAASNFKDGSYGSSIGQGIGTAIGGPIGGQIGKSLGEAVDKLFAKGEYVRSTGDANVTFAANGLRATTKTAAQINTNGLGSTTAEADKFVQGLQDQYLAAAKSLSIGAVATEFSFGSNSSDGGKFQLGGGATGRSGVNQEEIKTSPEAVQLAAQRAVFAALKGSDLPKYLAGVFDSVNAATATSDQINTTLAFAESLKQVRDSLTETRTPLQILQTTVADAFAALSTSADTFKTDFVAAIDSGITPDKLAAYLTLGQNLEQLAQVSGTASAAVGEVTRSLADIASERTRLQDQLDELTLSSADLLQKQRNAIDGSNRALFDQVQAATAAKDAQQALADASRDSAAAFTTALGGLRSTQFDLENQILSLQGQSAQVTARTRAAELSALTTGVTNPDEMARINAAFEYNQSLQAQVDALNAAQQAAADAASAQQQNAQAAAQAAQSMAQAAEQFRSAWQSVTDSIVSEVRRIRGVVGTPAQSFAQAQAQFSITAAQASAGDQSAAKALPELSRTLLTLAEAQATSLVQLQTIQGTTAGTLENIAKKYVGQFGLEIPQFAVGTNYVPQDMLAVVHKGEAIVPAAYNPATSGNGGGNDGALLAEVQAMRAEIAALRALHITGNESAKVTADTLRRVTRGGDAMQTQEFV